MNRCVQYQKCCGHFIGVHNKPPGILALCGHNPKLSALVIRNGDTAATPTGFAEIVPNSFPVPFHAADSASFALHTAMTN
jgi:hypothetical protein